MIDSFEALSRIRKNVLLTPLLKSLVLTERLGVDVFLKCENLQHINAFKIRGAENFLDKLSEDQRRRGVVAFSSGNHAQGVALAAARRNLAATIVMPSDAPSVKVARTRALGAKVILYDRVKESREQIAATIAKETGSPVIPAFDHPWIVEGQGTLGVEILEQLPGPGTVIVPMSGGGLASGVSLAIHNKSPETKIIGIEPDVGNDIQQSIQAGRIVSIPQPQSLADGLLAPKPGEVTFPFLKDHLAQVETATDTQILLAIRSLALDEKLIAEPSGAIGYAWAHQFQGKLKGPVVVILTGGNIKPSVLKTALA